MTLQDNVKRGILYFLQRKKSSPAWLSTCGFISSLDSLSGQLLQQKHEQLSPFFDTGVEERLIAYLPLVTQLLKGHTFNTETEYSSCNFIHVICHVIPTWQALARVEHMRYRADMTSGMEVGQLKSGRMTLRHLTHASTTMAAEKLIRLTTLSSNPLQEGKVGVAGEVCRAVWGSNSPADVYQCSDNNCVHFFHGWRLLAHSHRFAETRTAGEQVTWSDWGSRA